MVVTLEKTIKAAYSIDIAISNSHNFHRTVTENLQNYTDLQGELNCRQSAQYHQ